LTFNGSSEPDIIDGEHLRNHRQIVIYEPSQNEILPRFPYGTVQDAGVSLAILRGVAIDAALSRCEKKCLRVQSTISVVTALSPKIWTQFCGSERSRQ